MNEFPIKSTGVRLKNLLRLQGMLTKEELLRLQGALLAGEGVFYKGGMTYRRGNVIQLMQ